jgi:hypothetical protein
MDSRRAGLKVMAVNKFPGSINYGISLLKKFKIHIVDCDEFREEQGNYKYREINGIKLDEPIDDFNHCFHGDTLITTSEGDKPIRAVRPGDLVLTSTGFNEVFDSFDNGFKMVKTYVLVTTGPTIMVQCTPDHKVKTPEGMVPACELSVGMGVYHEDVREALTIRGIRFGEEWCAKVYDIAVMNTHEYYANGLLVSNCWDAARYAVMSNLR